MQHRDLAHIYEPRFTWRYGNDSKSDLFSPDDARPDVCKHIRKKFATIVRESGKTRLLEKHPSSSLRMGFVERVLPECKFIHITRYGVDSVLSLRSQWEKHAHGYKTIDPNRIRQLAREISPRQIPHYMMEVVRRLTPKRFSRVVGNPVWAVRIPGVDALMRDLELLDVCCLVWKWCAEKAAIYGQHLPADRYMQVRLEDLDESMLERLMEFAQLEHDGAVIDHYREKFDGERPGARRTVADPAELETIMSWIEPTLSWLGYLDEETS